MKEVIARMIDKLDEKVLFGLIIIGAFVAFMAVLVFVPLPGQEPGEKNAEYFGQGLVAIIGAVGIIVGAVWKTSNSEKNDRETINRLVENTPLVTEKEMVKDDRSNDEAAEGAACPVCGAYRHSPVASVSGGIPDSIPGVSG